MSRATSKTITTTTTDPTVSMTLEEQSHRYKALLKSHKQLEARVREEQRAAEWWKERVGVLDKRCRDVNTELRVALDENRALVRTVGFLKVEVGHLWRCRLVDAKDTSAGLDAFLQEAEKEMGIAKASWALEKWRRVRKGKGKEGSTGFGGVDPEAQKDSQEGLEKDLAIKALIQTFWDVKSESAFISANAATCGCSSARALRTLFPQSNGRAEAIEEADPLTAMLMRRKTRRVSRSRSRSLEVREGVPISIDQMSLASSTATHSPTTARSMSRQSGASSVTALVDAPPHPYPEIPSKARKEHKQALKMKLKATREMVDAKRQENEVLERLLEDGAGGTREDRTGVLRG